MPYETYLCFSYWNTSSDCFVCKSLAWKRATSPTVLFRCHRTLYALESLHTHNIFDFINMFMPKRHWEWASVIELQLSCLSIIPLWCSFHTVSRKLLKWNLRAAGNKNVPNDKMHAHTHNDGIYRLCQF